MSAKKNVRILRVSGPSSGAAVNTLSPSFLISSPPGCVAPAWQHNDKDTMQSFCFLQTVNLLTIGWSQELFTLINYHIENHGNPPNVLISLTLPCERLSYRLCVCE